MTVIDSLVVLLGLDAKDLEAKSPAAVKKLNDLEKQGERTEKSVDKVSKTSKETARSVDGLGRALGTLLATIGGTMAIKAFVQDFINTNAQLDRLSRNLGINVSDISAWSNATEKLGGSAQGLQGTLDMLSKSQTQLMLTGESSLIPYMSALGISLADVTGKARPATDILLELSERFSRMDRTTANNMGRMMGLDQGTMNLLLQGRKELELEIARQKEQNAVTKAQAEEASKLQRGIVGVKQSFSALGRTLIMEAAPTLEKVLDALQRFATWAQENKETVGDFLKILAVGLGAIAVASLPINLTVAAVVALAAGIALLWQDYQTWKRGGDSLINWAAWEPELKFAKDALIALHESIQMVIEGLTALKNLVPDSWARGLQKFVEGHFNTASPNPAANQRMSNLRGYLRQNGNSSTNAAEIQQYFQKQGWSPAQAAGIASNLMAESSGKTTATGDNGTAYGLAQWHADRQAAFKAWSGKDIHQATLEEQLAFIQYELTKGGETAAGNALRGASNAGDAGRIVSQMYERPKDAAGEASRRGAYAQSLLNGIPGASATVSGASQGSGAPATTVDKSVQTTIGTVTIETKATDADAMARDSRQALDWLFASQANWGLN